MASNTLTTIPWLSHRLGQGDLYAADMDFGVDENKFAYSIDRNGNYIPTVETQKHYEPENQGNHNPNKYPKNTIKFHPTGAMLNQQQQYPGQVEVVSDFPKFFADDYTKNLQTSGLVDISSATPYSYSQAVPGTKPALDYGSYGQYGPKKKQSEYKTWDVVLLDNGSKMTYDEYYKKYKNDLSHIIGTANWINPKETLQNADGTTTSYDGGMAKIRRDIKIDQDKQDVEKLWGGISAGIAGLALAPVAASGIATAASSPIVQQAARGLLAAEIGGRATDLGLYATTGRDWTGNINQLFGIDPYSITGEYIMPMTNPGYLAGGLVDKGLTVTSNALDRAASKIASEATKSFDLSSIPNLQFRQLPANMVFRPYTGIHRIWRTIAAPYYVGKNYFKIGSTLNGEQMPKGLWRRTNFWNDNITGRVNQRYQENGRLLYPVTEKEKEEVLGNLNAAAQEYSELVPKTSAPLEASSTMPSTDKAGSYNPNNETSSIYVRQASGSDAVNPVLIDKTGASTVAKHEAAHANDGYISNQVGKEYDQVLEDVQSMHNSLVDDYMANHEKPTYHPVPYTEQGAREAAESELEESLSGENFEKILAKDNQYQAELKRINDARQQELTRTKTPSKKRGRSNKNKSSSENDINKKYDKQIEDLQLKYKEKWRNRLLSIKSKEERFQEITQRIKQRGKRVKAKYYKEMKEWEDAYDKAKENDPRLQDIDELYDGSSEDRAYSMEQLPTREGKEYYSGRIDMLKRFYPKEFQNVEFGAQYTPYDKLPESYSFFNTPKWWTVGALSTLAGGTYYATSPWFQSQESAEKGETAPPKKNNTPSKPKTPQQSDNTSNGNNNDISKEVSKEQEDSLIRAIMQ